MGNEQRKIQPPAEKIYSNYIRISETSKNVPAGYDYLSFEDDSKIMNKLNLEEKIVFSSEILKLNDRGRWKHRSLLLTTVQLCAIEKHKFKRCIQI